jgi:capsular polysaccharide biosynthesis protein
MNEEALDLRGFLETIRRQMAVVIAIAALGLLGGIGYTLRYPPLPKSDVLVLLPSGAARLIGTQVVIASSEPVLAGALGQVKPRVTLQTLRSWVKATSLTPGIISITASGHTAAQASSAANAVADSYVGFIGRKNSAVGSLKAEVLSPATNTSKGSFWIHLLISGAVGLLLGTVIGAIVAFAIGRNRRPAWLRSEIARAVGAPVLASVPVSHPSGPAGWARLLQQYQPSAADAGSLRRVLHRVGLSDALGGYRSEGSSVIRVFSMDSDAGALAVGPQLAVFAASSGLPTTLIIGLHEEAKMTAKLRAAYSAARDLRTKPSGMLNVGIMDSDDDDWPPATPLAVVVSVVSGRTRRLTEIRPTTAALLAVSAGAATGEQLARIAVRISATGHHLAGTIVADPDVADYTTGQLSRSEWPTDRLAPNGQFAMTTEIRL